jgi:hypothetical protein
MTSAGAKDRRRKGKRYALYWCTTSDGDEDWFVVASSSAEARRFHEDAEGYDRGDAAAERVVGLPEHLLRADAWLDPKREEWSSVAGWPSDALLEACGGELAKLENSELHQQVGVVCKAVRFGSRVFTAGDIVTNMARVHGLEAPPRLAVFPGKKK